MKQFNYIDVELLRKYSKQGPRYTSYPTAPLFSSAFGPQEYLAEIELTNSKQPAPDLSLYFHLPYCDTLCYFCACTMQVTNNPQEIISYNNYLKKEIDLIAPKISKNRVVSQLHFGGGSPSNLPPKEILSLGNYIRQNFNFAENIEAGVEIDPRELTKAHLQAFREVGFNRVSIGVQDLDEKVQKAINRYQPESLTRDAINWSRELGFSSINIDLIYGLPHQTVASFTKTIDAIIALKPNRIAVFNYAHVPWMKKHQQIILAETLPSPQEKLEIFKLTIEKLTESGYWNIGMDHFALHEDELAIAQREHSLHRNFQGYSTKAGCDIYGFGMSAIGQFANTYQQNIKSIPEYYARLDAKLPATTIGYRLTGDDLIRREVIMALMCNLELNITATEKMFKINFSEYFKDSLPKLNEFIADELVKITPEKISVHGLGRLVIRNIAMCFDAYLEKMAAEKPVFSKTV